MYEGRRYIYVIFVCHLAVEKYLKALVAEKTRKIHLKRMIYIF